MKRPSENPECFQLAISGLTPQIDAETLYELAAQSVDRYIPTELPPLPRLGIVRPDQSF
jgi:hypothetical protein